MQDAENRNAVQEATASYTRETAEADLAEEYREAALSRQRTIEQTRGTISQTQVLRSYKMGLLFRRAKQQLFLDPQPLDFLKWVLEKLFRKDFHARRLKEFDPLEQLKRTLTQKQDDLIVWRQEEDRRFAVKDTQRVFIFAAVPFYDVGGGQRSAQLARTFNTLGKQVYYIYAYPCTEENIPNMEIPVSAHKYIESIDINYFRRRVKAGDLAIIELPFAPYEEYLDCAKESGAFTVYEHIDNWDSSLGARFNSEDVFRRFLEKADLITVTARKLGEKIEERCSRPYLYLPNAVNAEIFEPAKNYERPADMAAGREKTFLYFGSLWGEWFDWEKLFYLARHAPGCEINLIGDYSECREKKRQAPKNVRFLGTKRQTDLPAYLAYTDLALLPFKNCEIGSYVSPLKIFEYMAMNVRVLATPLDDIRGYPNVVCADTNEGWVQAASEDGPEVDNAVFISENNWYARCQKILEHAGSVRKNYPSVSVIVLNYNNLKIIGRCVDSLLRNNQFVNYEIIVVDNQSSDGSYEMLKERYAGQIVLLRNEKTDAHRAGTWA